MPDWNGTRADLVRSLRLIPEVLAGTYPDQLGLGAVFWGYIGNAALEQIEGDFDARMRGGVGPDGKPWAALKPSTLRSKRPIYPFYKDEILAETGKLLASLESRRGYVPSGAADQIFDIKPGSVTVGSKEKKADLHQYGTDRMPARPIVPPDGQIPKAWDNRIEEAMEDGLKAVIEIVCANGGIP